MRSPRMTAMGASKEGERSTARPGSASRNPFTQATSGNSRRTWRNDRRMPITSTPMISPFKPGLARNAAQIWRCRMITRRPPSTRKDEHPEQVDAGRGDLERVDVAFGLHGSSFRGIRFDEDNIATEYATAKPHNWSVFIAAEQPLERYCVDAQPAALSDRSLAAMSLQLSAETRDAARWRRPATP